MVFILFDGVWGMIVFIKIGCVALCGVAEADE